MRTTHNPRAPLIAAVGAVLYGVLGSLIVWLLIDVLGHITFIFTSVGADLAPRAANASAIRPLADAQVHATLAVASILGLSANLGAADMQTWRDVAATRP